MSRKIVWKTNNQVKAKTKEKLLGIQGVAHRKQPYWVTEAVFGNIKQNMNFKRFFLKGIEKVETEIDLVAMAHNLKKATPRAQTS